MKLTLLVESGVNDNNQAWDTFDTVYYELGEFTNLIENFNDTLIIETKAFAGFYHAKIILEKNVTSYTIADTSWKSLNGVEDNNFTELNATNGLRLDYNCDIVDYPMVSNSTNNSFNLETGMLENTANIFSSSREIISESDDYSLYAIWGREDTLFMYEKDAQVITKITNPVLKILGSGTAGRTFGKGVSNGNISYIESVIDPPSSGNDRRLLKFDYSTNGISTVKVFSTSDVNYEWNSIDYDELFHINCYNRIYTLQWNDLLNPTHQILYHFNETTYDWEEVNIGIALTGRKWNLLVFENNLYIAHAYGGSTGSDVYKIETNHTSTFVGKVYSEYEFTKVTCLDDNGIRNSYLFKTNFSPYGGKINLK
jgi:hypothetical protein